MKKLLSLTLVAVMLVLFVGCAPKVELSRGTIEGDVYKSEYLGLSFTKPESWVYSTDEEIASMVNLSADVLGDDFKTAVENNPTIYDMMVVDSITRSNINIGFENLAKTLSTNITEEQYIEAMEEQFKSVSAMTVEFPEESEKVKLGEHEYLRTVCKTTTAGVEMTQIYYLRKVDGYMTYVIATIVDGYTVADIEAMFS